MNRDPLTVRQPINIDGTATECVITIRFNQPNFVQEPESVSENTTDGKLLFKTKEAAEMLSLSRTHLYQFLTSGEIESFKIGRSRLIPKDAIENFIARYRQKASY